MSTKTELLDELRRLADEQGPDITLYKFREQTGISRHKVYDRWGNWTNLRRAAGLPPRVRAWPVYSDDELLREFHQVARQMGHVPTLGEFSRGSHRCWGTLDRRFGRKGTVVDKYRGWIDAQPHEDRPEFLDQPPVPPPKAGYKSPSVATMLAELQDLSQAAFDDLAAPPRSNSALPTQPAGAQAPPPPIPDYSKMSPEEIRLLHREVFGYNFVPAAMLVLAAALSLCGLGKAPPGGDGAGHAR
ncbi:MAG: hypothetical protein SFV23_14855, partial [Planctomycetaceae bacterium]|nr:hypothetical protein [Planctomycetaceae bacterium]